VTIDLISPLSLRLPQQYRDYMTKKGITFHEGERLDGIIEQADVAYITRVQRERFSSQADYDAVKDVYVINAETANRMKPQAIIMHALPRVNEIAPDVDANARAAYFRQAKNGLYIRMALLKYLLS
jgi:aspartate carbamoyltransferase catalytic subunit